MISVIKTVHESQLRMLYFIRHDREQIFDGAGRRFFAEDMHGIFKSRDCDCRQQIICEADEQYV